MTFLKIGKKKPIRNFKVKAPGGNFFGKFVSDVSFLVGNPVLHMNIHYRSSLYAFTTILGPAEPKPSSSAGGPGEQR